MFSRLSFLAPFLCALYPFISLYLQNFYYFSFFETIQVIVAVIISLLIIWKLLIRLFKSRDKALFYLWFFVLALGLFQYISQGIYVLTGNRGGFAVANSIGFVVWISMLWPVSKLLLSVVGKHVNRVLEIGAVFSVMLCAVSLGNHTINLKDTEIFSSISRTVIKTHPDDRWPSITTFKTSEPRLLDKSQYPDIYFILTDGLGRQDILKEYFDYDSAPFEDGLKAEGLYIVEKARSNYSQTLLAFPTMLNFNYLSDDVGQLGIDRSFLIKAFNDNKLTSGLRELGYKILAFESSYPGTQGMNADIVYPVPGYTNQFLQNSLVVLSFPPLSNVLSSWQLNLHRKKSKNILENIGKLECQSDTPKFVMSHLMMPHPPFVVDEEGNEINLGEPSNIDGVGAYSPTMYKKHYSAQAKYVHNRLLNAVRQIKGGSCRPTYIIITADHGSLLNEVKKGPATPTLMRERSSIFSAVLFPDQDYAALRPDMTPINLVRETLNHTGLADLPSIEERSFYSSWDRPYEFTSIPLER